ncbi:MAG: decarboxylating 6-phosphogluconate dehydrogenase [Desulfuromonadaceae bacterium]|nr:decarboxylating 6-phosphogluconate dehydrogenase [Desulfuromonadaceae bacterium]MDD2849257.1 decarboxylating 6-phosphogluconate dehydrogenase [Desulfuromonadaceae bacterium]MDD4131884.1 decarboxylating 6-phosphogluconate dehydrogenase [Desulfuromonadaceae bacterium]
MQLGMIGLGRMGADMVRRLLHSGHECVVFDMKTDAVETLENEGAVGARSIEEFVSTLVKPRVVWLMVPAAVTDSMIANLTPLLDPDDILIDGGNSYYLDDLRRAAQLQERGIRYLDVGTSGGVWGAERGYCLMIGGEKTAVELLNPVFAALAPGIAAAPRTEGREKSGGTAEQGYLHCGPSGAGHFVKMVHNGIEYGLMAAYAEGLNILHHANVGKQEREVDAETTPLRHPEHYQYDFNLPDITEVWRRGSVISSWLLDLAANGLLANPDLENFKGRVSDSGEGRWTSIAAIEVGVPAHVLSAALYERFSSRGEADFGDRVMSAMRYGFGGHLEKTTGKIGGL